MVVIYFIKQSLLEKKKKKETRQKLTFQREKSCRPPSYFVNSHNTHAKAYDLSTSMSIFLLAFKSTYGRRARNIFTSYSYGC